MFRYVTAVLFVTIVSADAHGGEKAFPLKGGETVVFFGDSITQAGGYVNYFEAYLLTRFPEKSFRVINHGISSETISGTSEEDHHPRRPWALPRFTRDITKWKPDVVVACFGMNDGNYYPFEPTRYKAYQKGIRTLIDRTAKEAKLILMTPPPYDPYRRRTSDPEAKTYGYKFAAVNYDDTLRHYSEFVVSLRKDGQTVVDLHSKMNAHLKKRREKKVSYSFSPDAVHPNATGHWLMAQHLLLEMHAPATVAEIVIETGSSKLDIPGVVGLKADGRRVAFQWKSPLPMPMDPAWDAESIALEKVAQRLNRYRLTVKRLKAGTYTIYADGKPVGEATAKQLASGINLLTLEELPTVKASQELLKLVKQRRGLNYRIWRTTINKPLGKPLTEKQIKENKRRIAELDQKIAELRKPVAMAIEISLKSTR